ncbi:hypothetical protein H072_3189 [Dactylellina haptotyla CBS 200.50]|uniref:Ribosomal RNA-processing protein 1 n=1 Tax=Dactylellina haptotyla (strain CBS 200.50) TaxID=1284197 RepID=S8AIS0_DACHA|nr:hypothetical protein H072_3189 [Dactylellina haptotyla CBS 200.50]
MSSDNSIQQTPFVKQLAANDRPTRDKAVESLKTYLSSSRTFTQSDFLKLWKGLFYCMWLSDRARTQQRLADELASLVDVIKPNNVFTFLEAFWTTITREWTSIDALRMDKFMLLVRRYVAASLRYLYKTGWNEEVVRKNNEVLEVLPLHPTNGKLPDGLRYHLIDIYVDELTKIAKVESEEDGEEDAEEEYDITPEQAEALLKPFRKLQKETLTKPIKKNVTEMLEDDRLQLLLKAPSG